MGAGLPSAHSRAELLIRGPDQPAGWAELRPIIGALAGAPVVAARWVAAFRLVMAGLDARLSATRATSRSEAQTRTVALGRQVDEFAPVDLKHGERGVGAQPHEVLVS